MDICLHDAMRGGTLLKDEKEKLIYVLVMMCLKMYKMGAVEKMSMLFETKSLKEKFLD